ncbi:alpha/beta hydrolase [Galactobacter valiniphilus]|uniref:alpha/beta hydrolase n=1 Tax=Galactobacter valiniphilus TaxID=2676122 RepID=UPI001313E7F8|nr:alpha/beta hydrolase [Galactobacter valiniphilus]
MSPNPSRTVTSADGGTLRLVTHGHAGARPEHSIVVVCGAFLPAAIYAPFAAGLLKNLPGGWAVHVYDRRGKGASSPLPEGYSMDTEIADVAAVLTSTGARHLLGHSLGGSVTLNAVQAFAGQDRGDRHFDDPALVPARTAVYDPAINVEGSLDTRWVEDFSRLVDEGKLGRALALADREFGATPTLSKAPSWMVAGVLALSLRTPLARVARSVFPAGAAELKAALGERAAASDFADLPTDTLFMTGERSAEYFQATTRALAAAVPGSLLEIAPKGVHGSIPAVRHDVVTGLAAFFRGDPPPSDAQVARR